MTCIAWRNGVLAGERACNNAGCRTGYRPKVFKIEIAGGAGDGANLPVRVGMTGDLGACLAIVEWLKGGKKGKPPSDEGSTVIVAPYQTEPYLIENGYEQPLADAPYHAWGMGRDFALGAMHYGGGAADGVAAAVAHCHTCGGEIDALGPR